MLSLRIHVDYLLDREIHLVLKRLWLYWYINNFGFYPSLAICDRDLYGACALVLRHLLLHVLHVWGKAAQLPLDLPGFEFTCHSRF